MAPQDGRIYEIVKEKMQVLLSVRAWAAFQRLAHLVQQLLAGKRLCNQQRAGIDDTVVSNGIFGVARHIQHFDFFPSRRHSARHFPAAHLRHDHVRQKKMDGAVVFSGEPECISAALGFQTC